jgi:hypothetical protein
MSQDLARAVEGQLATTPSGGAKKSPLDPHPLYIHVNILGLLRRHGTTAKKPLPGGTCQLIVMLVHMCGTNATSSLDDETTSFTTSFVPLSLRPVIFPSLYLFVPYLFATSRLPAHVRWGTPLDPRTA